MALRNLFGGPGREGCFYDSKNTSADVAVVCHEARGVDAGAGDVVTALLRDTRRPGSEVQAAVGASCTLRAVELDTTLLLRVFVGRTGGGGACRVCGELRIPLARLGLHAGGLMYQTWLELDAPGLADSVSSVSSEAIPAQDPFAVERLLAGAQRMSSPRICLSVCRASDLGPNGRLVLGPDAPAELRANWWGALLRSQQQHAMMSVALHAHGPLANGAEDCGAEPRRRIEDQAREIEALRSQLQDAVESPTLGGFSDCPTHRSLFNDLGVERARSANEKKRAELQELRSELDRVSSQANEKIDLANERLRELKRDRDEARAEAARLQTQCYSLRQECDHLHAESHQLAKDKEELLLIVEDLHNSCAGAGLSSAGRQSIDSTLANLKIH